MGVIKKNASEFDITNEFYLNSVELRRAEEEHTHNFIEIVYTLEGRGLHRVDGREYIVKSGDALVINYHRTHAVEPLENLRYVDVMVKSEFLSETLRGTDDIFLLLRLGDFSDISNLTIKDNLLLHFEGDERKKIEFLISWAREEQMKRAPGAKMVMRCAISMLFGLVFRKMAEDQTARLALNDQLLSYVERNSSSRLPINEIAAKCGYTPEHFSRIFKKYTGKSPVAYITECRIRRAKELLATTDRPIEAIVFDCGFSDRTAFFKKFRALVGVTPLQFRKDQK